MTTTTDHTTCYRLNLHDRTSKGRAACRKAGGPVGLATKGASALRDEAEALCADCYSQAFQAAAANIDEDPDLRWVEEEAPLLLYFLQVRTARSYLYDIAALSACTEHEDKL